jgi:hypothetical protein
MDAMALVHTYGKPDIFLTMTCNPNWQEILDELLPGQTPQDRPDLVARVFRAKLETMKDMLTKNHILGVVKAYVYVVEFQKRGTLHTHFMLVIDLRYINLLWQSSTIVSYMSSSRTNIITQSSTPQS